MLTFYTCSQRSRWNCVYAGCERTLRWEINNAARAFDGWCTENVSSLLVLDKKMSLGKPFSDDESNGIQPGRTPAPIISIKYTFCKDRVTNVRYGIVAKM